MRVNKNLFTTLANTAPQMLAGLCTYAVARRRAKPHQQKQEACASPSIDYERLLRGADHRHSCELVQRACLFNATIVPFEAGSADAKQAAAIAGRMQVRDMWESGQVAPLSKYHPLHAPAAGSAAARLLADEVAGRGFSACVPLFWMPTWVMNFGESLVASLLPIDELQRARLIDDRVLLTPELWRFPGRKFSHWRCASHHHLEPLHHLWHHHLHLQLLPSLPGWWVRSRTRGRRRGCEASWSGLLSARVGQGIEPETGSRGHRLRRTRRRARGAKAVAHSPRGPSWSSGTARAAWAVRRALLREAAGVQLPLCV